MCLTLAIASVGMSVVGAVQQSNAQKAQAEYNSQVQENNALIARRNAREVRKAGATAAEERGKRTRQVIGAAKAAMASNGLLVDDEIGTTPDSLLKDLSDAGALDVQRIYANAVSEEHRALVQGANFEAQAGLFELQGKSINPFMSGLTAGLDTATTHSDILFPV